MSTIAVSEDMQHLEITRMRGHGIVWIAGHPYDLDAVLPLEAFRPALLRIREQYDLETRDGECARSPVALAWQQLPESVKRWAEATKS